MRKLMPGKSIDPFAEEELDQVNNRLKRAERGTYVEQTLTPTPAEQAMEAVDEKFEELKRNPVSGELMTYTAIADFGEDLSLVPLDELQGEPLLVHKFDEWNGENGAFLTLEVSRFYLSPEQRFLTNCGGQSVMQKIKAAFAAVAEGKATPPLVGTFRKIKTGTGRDFWTIS